MLTTMDLQDMEPNTAFASGVLDDGRLPLWSDTDGGQQATLLPVQWIAFRGDGAWWAIFYTSIKMVETYGIKAFSDVLEGNWLHTEAIIRQLVPCSNEAYAQYKFQEEFFCKEKYENGYVCEEQCAVCAKADALEIPGPEDEDEDRIFSATDIWDAMHHACQEAMAAGFAGTKTINGKSIDEFINEYVNELGGS